MAQINISLKSYNSFYIKNAILHISKIIQKWNIPLQHFKYITLPQKKKKITLLKSPHVHKKAREQFELVKQSSQVQLHLYDTETGKKHLLLLALMLYSSQFPGTELHITMLHSTHLQ